MKKRPMPSSMDLDLAFVVDVTGSMAPYAPAAAATIKCIVDGENSIVAKLQSKFPDMEFKVNVATLAFRDIDDADNQFQESVWRARSVSTHLSRDLIKTCFICTYF